MRRFFHTLVAAPLVLALLGAQAQDGDSVGGVADLQGVAEAERNAPEPLMLALQDPVYRTDLLRTHLDSHLTVALDDGSWFSMDADTEARMEEYVAGQDAVLTMAKGRLRVFVSDTFSRYDNAFRVQTDDAVIGVQGTFFIVTRLIAETTLYVIQGIVSVTSTDPRYPDPVIAQAGQFVRVPANSPPSPPIDIDPNVNFGQSANPYDAWGPYWGRTLAPTLVVPVPLPGTGPSLVNRAIIQGTTPPPPPPPRPAPAGPAPAAPGAAAPAGRAAPAAPAAGGAPGAGGAAAPAPGAAPPQAPAAARPPPPAAPPPAIPSSRPGPPTSLPAGKDADADPTITEDQQSGDKPPDG